MFNGEPRVCWRVTLTLFRTFFRRLNTFFSGLFKCKNNDEIFFSIFEFYLGTELKLIFPLLSVLSSLISKKQRNLIDPSNVCCWFDDDWFEFNVVCCCNWLTVATIGPSNDVLRRVVADCWFVVRRNALEKLWRIR